MKTRDLLFLTTACGLAIAAAPSRAQSSGDAAAQAADAAEDEAPAELVITGSRIDRAGFDAPTPTTVLSGDALLQGDRPSIAQVLNDLPQFRASTSPVTNFSGTASGSSPADLRGLGTTRTLTLLNGRRFTGAGDLNTVPQGLISRVEVVTGGASAAWGSGAVGGVVNILLNEKLEGLMIGAQSGVSSREDAFRYGFDASFGTKFADGAGHFMIGVQYMNDEGVLDRDSRPNLGSTTLFSKPGGGRVIAQDVNYSNASVGGLITTGVLAGQTFERDGTLRPFRFGSPNDGSSMVGGEGTSLRDETALSAPYQRLNGYARASFELGDAKLWVDGSYSRMWAEYPFYAESNRGGSSITVSRDNPFLPKAVRDRLIAANQTSFRMGRVFEDYGYRTFGYTRETIDAAIGIDGSFDGGKWRYSAYYGHGQLIDDRGYLNQKVDANFTRAIDVVAHPVTGAPICRVALTDPATACRPLNVFGEGNADPAAVAYAFSNTAHVRNTTKLDTAAISLRGDPFSLWAGPVSVAIGAEARWESIESSGLDPISAARGFTTFNFSELNGGFNVKEGFAEVAVPLLDQDFSKLEFSAAGRYSHYSNTGSVNSWKLGLTNRVYSELLLRVSRSRDIRSGSLSELFTNRSTTRSTVADGANGSYEIITYGGGNQALDPEIGETTTAGVTWSPSSVPGLSLSVDYFDIRIKGAISTLSGQDIITRCANGNTALCGQIVRGSDNKIAHIFATFVNLAEYKTHGIDFEASYNLPLSKLSAAWPGTLKFRGLATYVPSLTTDDGVSKIEYAGEVGEALPFGTPKWRASGSLTYQDQTLSVDARLRYVAGGMWNSALKDLENNAIKARTYVDLGARVTIDKLTLSLNVNNLFDVDPPLTTTGQIHYDQIGRYFSTTAKIRF
ncbi:TonB-dependent receptor [Sphingomonas koreensis]|jgi:iron complex outermembrane receptor protein|uniref:TonB-dependent receptor n=1 Tax=Sphingomonas koreensis TaxID=93064 RepID=A0A1L6JFJ1_9SPHN|nr:TonB-dependent receptor plug domain-containing protein [Sphingomonas koreensis]APR54702.1 TonB-dependent receptor [Sphingomonas koreensis]MDC7810711.1 TonB-dependent receptor [Sphingomonas koreensis]RSU20322.1 TonB-dependent receptor [Sphingomonas koreensis]RSU22245.1 TonB-dependent receptor [Sphingomonas koreensis]RSU29506.1 TonB-dependent receptor [Sphingomonas koreensis]